MKPTDDLGTDGSVEARHTAGVAAPDRLEILRSLTYANVDVAFATAFGTLFSGAFLVGFIQLLGGSDLWVGLLSAVPSLVGLLQIPGAIWGRSFRSYKAFIIPGGVLWRLFYVPILALPFVPMPNTAKLIVLAILVSAASVATTLVNPIYNDWLAEMVPPDSRGFYFGRRNAIATAVGALVGIVGAFVLDALRGEGYDRLGYSLVFGLGLVCASISMSMFLRMTDIPRVNPVRQGLVQGIIATANPFRDRNYRSVLLAMGMLTLGQSFAGNLFNAYGLESIHLDFKILQGATVTYAIGNVLTARMWGFLSDRYGNKPMLILVALLVSVNPLPWMLLVPHRLAYDSVLLLSAHVVMGASWGGFALFQFNLMLATADEQDRANYIGACLTVIALVGGGAPLVGATLMTSLRHVMAPQSAYDVVFGVTAVLRLVGAFFLVPVGEKGASTFRTTMGDLRRVTPRGFRALRSLSRTSDAGERAEAIEQAGRVGIALASDAIIKALHDPLPAVRREAAAAIAKLNDPRATGELIHQIDEHPDLLEEETIQAIGQLGDPAAIPALIRTLRSPRPLLRRAAAKALGKVAGPSSREAIDALATAAADPSDADLRRAALQGLRVCGAAGQHDVFVRGLLDPYPSIRIAAAEGVSVLRVAGAVAALRQSLVQYDDEAASESAYALGVVGDSGDLGLILNHAAKQVSMITRRRCLLGVAAQLGVEDRVYRLMLKEGMDRDTALIETMRPLLRKHPGAKVALGKFASGEEAEAMRLLFQITEDPDVGLLCGHEIEELFLVGACVAAAAETR